MNKRRLMRLFASALLVGVALAGGTRADAQVDPGTTKIRACSDPSIFMTASNRYMFCTGGNVYTSGADELDWPTDSTSALSKSDWAPRACGFLWGPSVLKRAASYGNQYVMVYSSRWTDDAGTCTDRRCLYVATASSPDGEYSTPSEHPSGILKCDTDNTYSGQWYRGAGGMPFVAARRDGVGLAVHQVNPDLMTLTTEPWIETELTKTRPWEEANGGPLEGPAFLQLPSNYWVMFYAAGNWHTTTYAEGYVVCGNGNRPTFPCSKPSDNKLTSAYGQSFGLGSGSGYIDNAGVNMVVSGYFGPVDCTTDCDQKHDTRYARIFRLKNVGATPPNNIGIVTPALQ
jgi:Glycosyl hydrolases family 43